MPKLFFRLDRQLYSVYVRNRLLNIISTTLAHSSGQVNAQLSELLVNTLGFGWFLALCEPSIHPGTLFLALRTLVGVLKYPTLMEKFREGSANGGWLTDAEQVTRNRAAVLLGFSVSAHGGAVGSSVDINAQLSHCGGFAALEVLMASHAERAFAYVAVLALLFGQHQPNLQVEEFSTELLWSHVFSLKVGEDSLHCAFNALHSMHCICAFDALHCAFNAFNALHCAFNALHCAFNALHCAFDALCNLHFQEERNSVAHALQQTVFCPEALLPLLAMIRAGLHHPSEPKPSWSRDYPVMLVQLLSFLYQNAADFFLICHTETFAVALFTTLVPPACQPQGQTHGQAEPMGQARCNR